MIHTILELQSAKGTNEKKAVIEKYSDNEWFKTFLFYALNPTLTYHLSESTLQMTTEEINRYKLSDGENIFDNIFNCCALLSQVRGITDKTVEDVKKMLAKYEDSRREIYIQLLSKTIRLGVKAKTVNKIIPNLIPEWEVQQAFPIDKYPIKEGTEFWLSQKLNGVRATFYEGKLLARSGVTYTNLDHIIKEISWVDTAGFVLDGELTLLDKRGLSDNEAFRESTGIINSDSVDKTGICYTVFDMIPKNDFESAHPCLNYSQRRLALDQLSKQLVDDKCRYTSVLPILYHGTDINQIPILLDQMVREDKEGLMLNMDVPYKRNRHKGILKIKRFYTMDLPIIGYEEGTGRLQGTLGAFVLDYKGNEVKVGSGFSDEQRETFWKDRDEMIGSLCEVKYKEISSDKKTGLESLQFPVFVGMRYDKNEVSYA